MASKNTTPLALFLMLNLVFFTLVSSCGTCPDQKPKPKPEALPLLYPTNDYCSKDTLKLGVCAGLLSGLIGRTVGTPPKTPCCSLIAGLADLEAAVCVCTAIKANVLGINLNVPISLSLLLNACYKKVPKDFICT